jgi:hypothetical protein
VFVLRQFRLRLNLHHCKPEMITVDGTSEVALGQKLRRNRIQMFDALTDLIRDGHDRVDDYRDV